MSRARAIAQRLLDRIINLQSGELLPVLLAALWFFLILSAFMVLRPARESLGLTQGIDTVRGLFMATMAVTLLVAPGFSWLVTKLPRHIFIPIAYACFIPQLLIFHLLLIGGNEAIGETTGRIFYIWLSVFNVFGVTVFWALMADGFSLAQSKRLFGAVAIGGTLGAISGSGIASLTVERLGTPALLLIASGLISCAILCVIILSRLFAKRRADAARLDEQDDPDNPWRDPAAATHRAGHQHPGDDHAGDAHAVIGGRTYAFITHVVRSPYLLGMCGFILLTAIMATVFYFLQLRLVEDLGQEVDRQTRTFANIDLWTQVATLLLQGLLTGHIMRRLGVGVALVILPVISAIGIGALAIFPTIGLFIIVNAAFKAVQHGMMRPARETLFTVLPREDKYKAKTFIDTFVYRTGDVVGAQAEKALDAIGGLTAVALVVLPLAPLWAALGIYLARTQQHLAEDASSRRPPSDDLSAHAAPLPNS